MPETENPTPKGIELPAVLVRRDPDDGALYLKASHVLDVLEAAADSTPQVSASELLRVFIGYVRYGHDRI